MSLDTSRLSNAAEGNLVLEPEPWASIRDAELVDVERLEGTIRVMLQCNLGVIALDVSEVDIDSDVAQGDRVSVLVQVHRSASIERARE